MNSPRTKPSIARRVGRFVGSHLRIAGLVLEYPFVTGRWHLAPLILLLLLVGMLIFVSSNPAVSPFLYALF